MCLQYRHLTDTVYAFLLLPPEEENLEPRLLYGPSFKQRNKWSQKEISICNKLLCMAKCNLSLCGVFKWSLMFVGKKLCKETKKTKDVSERNSSSERAHFKKCVVPVTIQDMD